MEDPPSAVSVRRSFEPTTLQDEIAAAITGDIAETQSVSLALVINTMSNKLAGAFTVPIGYQFVDYQRRGRGVGRVLVSTP